MRLVLVAAQLVKQQLEDVVSGHSETWGRILHPQPYRVQSQLTWPSPEVKIGLEYPTCFIFMKQYNSLWYIGKSQMRYLACAYGHNIVNHVYFKKKFLKKRLAIEDVIN